jgi:hypothetical protein
MDRLAPVLQLSEPLRSTVQSAINWARRVRKDGGDWSVLPKPTVSELYPNMGNAADAPWAKAKKDIATRLEELTLLWQVGPEKRNSAHESGVFRWRNPACNPAILGITGAKQAPVLQAMLDINRSSTSTVVSPTRITTAQSEWRPLPELEFYVDFETVSDLDDDFVRMPKKSGEQMIFMIGCGHIENHQWQFVCFTASSLEPKSEAEIIDAWIAHMKAVKARLCPTEQSPRVFHWSHAEVSMLVTAYNSAVSRHRDKSSEWTQPFWFDFLKQVIKAEPVVIRGAFAFGLKAIATALYDHGFIKTCWESGPTDGLGAMVGAWSCATECKANGTVLTDHPLMREIANYNEVDCRVMMEVVEFLRASH